MEMVVREYGTFISLAPLHLQAGRAIKGGRTHPIDWTIAATLSCRHEVTRLNLTREVNHGSDVPHSPAGRMALTYRSRIGSDPHSNGEPAKLGNSAA